MDQSVIKRNLLELGIDEKRIEDFIDEKERKSTSCCQLKYYSAYFDLDTGVFCKRMCRSVFPFASSPFFGESIPDL